MDGRVAALVAVVKNPGRPLSEAIDLVDSLRRDAVTTLRLDFVQQPHATGDGGSGSGDADADSDVDEDEVVERVQELCQQRGSAVVHLRLSGYCPDTSAVQECLQSCTQLVSLDLSGNDYSNKEVLQVLSAVAEHASVTRLNLSGNELGGKLRPNKRADKAHLEALAQRLAACSRLKELDLSENNLGPHCAGLLTALAQLTGLSSLSLARSNLGPVGCSVVADALLSLPDLQLLDLNSNHMCTTAGGLEPLQALARALGACQQLGTLDLAKNNLGSDGGALLATGLARCSMLQSLAISVNLLGDGGGEAVVVAVKGCRHLASLDMRDNKLGRQTDVALAAALPGWRKLQLLDVGATSLANEPQFGRMCAGAIGRCDSLAQLNLIGTSLEVDSAIGMMMAAPASLVDIRLSPDKQDHLPPHVRALLELFFETRGIRRSRPHQQSMGAGLDVAAARRQTEQVVHEAGADGNLELVRFAVSLQVPVNAAAPTGARFPGSTPLHHAARLHDADTFHWLLNRGAQVSSRDVNGNTVMHYACMHLESSVASVDASVDDIDRGLRGLVRVVDEFIYSPGSHIAELNHSGTTAARLARRSLQKLLLDDTMQRPGSKAHMQRLDKVVDRLEQLTAIGPALETLTRADGTKVVRRNFGRDDYFEVVSRPPPPTDEGPAPSAPLPVSADPSTSTTLRGTYYRPRMLDFKSKRGVVDRAVLVVTFVTALVGALLTFVDFASDIAVVVELWVDGDRLWSVASATIVAVTIIISVSVLLRERRIGTAVFQLVSLGPAWELVGLVARAQENVLLNVTNSSPLLGAHAAKQLKSLEAVAESAPQMVLQLYIALTRGYTTALARSLALALCSLGLSLALGDTSSVQAHAARDSGRQVSFPLVAAVVEGRVAEECRRAGKLVFTVADKTVLVSGHAVIVVAFRVVEVIARLGVAALLCAVAASWALLGVAVASLSSAVWWFSGLPVVAATLSALDADVWEHVSGALPTPMDVSLGRVIIALIYSGIAFPGVGQAPEPPASKRPSPKHGVREGGARYAVLDTSPTAGGPPQEPWAARKDNAETPVAAALSFGGANGGDPAHRVAARVKLTVEPWMQSLWTPHWSLDPLWFLCFRTVENATVFAILLAAHMEYAEAHWREVSVVGACVMLYVPLFVLYLKVVNRIPQEPWFFAGPKFSDNVQQADNSGTETRRREPNTGGGHGSAKVAPSSDSDIVAESKGVPAGAAAFDNVDAMEQGVLASDQSAAYVNPQGAAPSHTAGAGNGRNAGLAPQAVRSRPTGAVHLPPLQSRPLLSSSGPGATASQDALHTPGSREPAAATSLPNAVHASDQ